jgi:hypothetical protein
MIRGRTVKGTRQQTANTSRGVHPNAPLEFSERDVTPIWGRDCRGRVERAGECPAETDAVLDTGFGRGHPCLGRWVR